jgi:hypothetical protein
VTEEQKQFLLDNIKNLHREDVSTMVEQLDNINVDVAYVPGTSVSSKSTKTSKINDTQLDQILAVIRANFDATEFQNKDLSPLVQGLTARQVPSRIKKLVDAGHLTDLGGSPKKYILS